MSGFEKKLHESMFVIGQFFQINWYNPFYLDRTGQVMYKTENILDEWKGGPEGYNFNVTNTNSVGSLSIDKLWIKCNENMYYEKKDFEKTKKTLTKVYKLFIKEYDVKEISRIGVRTQMVYTKNIKINNIMSHLMQDSLPNLYEDL